MNDDRPDITAATRGGDWAQRMDGEGPPAQANKEEAAYWLRVYTEILEMEEKVLRRVVELMATQSAEVRREVELTNLPVIVSQAERFRQRRSYWQARALQLDGDGAKPLNVIDGADQDPADESPSQAVAQKH